MVKTTQRPPISGQLLLFLTGIAFAEASRTMTMVQVPIFLREMGAEIDEIGVFFTISLIFPLLLRILGGWVADRIGRLRAIWFGSLAGALAYIPYAIAPSWEVALLGPALLAVATALIAPSYRAHIADTTDRKYLGRVFGITETVRNTAWILGPPLGGLLAQYLGYRWLFAAAILSYTIASIIFLVMTRSMVDSSSILTDKPSFNSFWASLREMVALGLSGGLVTWILISDGVADIASKLSFDLMPVYLSDVANLSKQSVGLLDGLHGIAWVAVGVIGGWIVDKAGERVNVVLGLILLILSRLIFAFASDFGGFALSWILIGVSGALFKPALNSLVSKGVPSHLLGITFAFIATSEGIISMPFPWIGSQVWNTFGPKAPFLMTVFFASFAIVPAWFKLIPPEKTPERDEQIDSAGS